MRAYKTLLRPGEFTEVINKSRFISLAAPAETEETAAEILRRQKALYPDATHHCYAFILGADGNLARFQDDGEPSGTAGMPILEVLRRQELTNVLVIVTRYFGGTLLGAGGLVRAYTSGAAGALQNAVPALMTPSLEYTLSTDYARYARLEPFLKNSDYIRLLDVQYGEKITLRCMIRATDQVRLAQDIAARTDGQVQPEKTDSKYYPWVQ